MWSIMPTGKMKTEELDHNCWLYSQFHEFRQRPDRRLRPSPSTERYYKVWRKRELHPLMSSRLKMSYEAIWSSGQDRHSTLLSTVLSLGRARLS